SGISSGKKIEYPFTLVHPDLQSPLGVRARVMLRGRTTSMDIQHNISVFLNDSFLFSSTWKGQETADLISQPGSYVSASSLQNGVNRLSIVNNVEPQNYDFVMLNWFEITYPRLYRAYKNFIKFSIPPASPGGKFLFRVDGFTESGIEVYKLHQSKINGGVIEEVTDFSGYTSLQISFQNDVFSPDVEFVAVTESAKKKPLKIIKDQPTALKSENLAADYLIISHRRFIQSQALKDLIALRQSQGLTVLAVDAEDIYDEFNYGHVSTFAIKEFIRHAYLNWQSPKLEYVLLVGDGSYVRRTAEGDTLDLVPVHMRQTMSFGAAASDHWYTLLTGDDEIPEVAIGRLPVRTKEELERFIGKIIRYETNPPVGDWANRFLIIGGNGDDFRSQGIALSKIMPPQINTRLLFSLRDRSAPIDPYFGGTTDLLDYFSRGCSIMTFHGHGGGAIWADNGLLRVEDCRRINTRGKFPFIISMTCFTGAFESPETESLADALLMERDDGAAAFFGASGVGWTWNDYFLQSEIMKQIFTYPSVPMGKMIAAAKIAYLAHYQTPQAFSQVNQYHLLGDPAMRLHIPQGSVSVSLKESIALPGDTLKAVGKTSFQIGFGIFDLEDSLRLIVSSHTLETADSLAKGRLIVKDSFKGESGIVRFFAADELNRRRVNGAAPVSLKGIVFDSTFVARAANDSLYFYAHVRSRAALQQLWCYVLNDSLPLAPLENNWFKSERGIFIVWSGFQFSYYFKATDAEGRTVTSRLYKHYINLDVDVEVAEGAIRYIGGEWVMLEATVQNKSGNTVTGLEVLYRTKTPSDSLWQTVGKDTISIDAYATSVSRIRHTPSPGELWVEVVLDPDSLVREDTKENNRTAALLTPRYFQATPEGFLLAEGRRSELQVGRLSIEMPAGALKRPSALAVWPLEKVSI
ncbi:MAG: C25 family cysteine peptidase, partial [candidate division KSB1 bacterium]|nr:C25 family cysteine peptidase [candidate division KSB1 bacterium]